MGIFWAKTVRRTAENTHALKGQYGCISCSRTKDRSMRCLESLSSNRQSGTWLGQDGQTRDCRSRGRRVWRALPHQIAGRSFRRHSHL